MAAAAGEGVAEPGDPGRTVVDGAEDAVDADECRQLRVVGEVGMGALEADLLSDRREEADLALRLPARRAQVARGSDECSEAAAIVEHAGPDQPVAVAPDGVVGAGCVKGVEVGGDDRRAPAAATGIHRFHVAVGPDANAEPGILEEAGDEFGAFALLAGQGGHAAGAQPDRDRLLVPLLGLAQRPPHGGRLAGEDRQGALASDRRAGLSVRGQGRNQHDEEPEWGEEALHHFNSYQERP